MIEQKYKDLIEELINVTTLKKITWEKTKRENEFKVTIGSNVITTDNWYLNSGNKCVDLGILNQRDELIIHIAYEDNNGERQDYAYLMRLYIAAKNSYFKVDEVYDEIMVQLNNMTK